ncbi:uncharacterized protein LOC108910374 isoform X2 [Anoplophora glabripennis]|uniref:uncharacterized protein LOC108910374 isoform X2 n=1 Tax=Anoplophora glabripennis TaxID=217634 RepID=UPI000875A0DA|nr:uncharacterized protein LOC108910374 isoform X2 [Anoplophora glabripennis]
MNACSLRREASPHYIRVPTPRMLILRQNTTCDTSCLVYFSLVRYEMKYTWLMLASCLVLVLAELVPAAQAGPYVDDEETFLPGEEDYSENAIDRLLQSAQKRACVRRGGNCDHRPNDCCYNSSCRCNLWGSNCRCQRMGLFQKWG